MAKASLVPVSVTGESELVEANSKLALGSAVVGFVAAAPAVAILQLAGADWVVRTGAVVFLAATIAGLRLPRIAVRGDGEGEAGGAAGRSRRIEKAKALVLAAGATAVLRGLVGFVTFLVAFVLRRSDAPSWWFGITLAASLGGGFVGNLIAPRLRDRLHEERIVMVSLGLVGSAALVATQLGGRGAAVLVGAAVGMGAAAGKLAFDAMVQRDVSEADRGRAFSRFEAWFQMAWVVGAILPVLIPFSFTAGFVVMGVAAGAGAIGYPLTRRRLIAP